MQSIRLPLLTPLFLLFAALPYTSHAQGGDARPVEAGPGGSIAQEPKFRTRAEEQFDWHIHASWESRYVTEGRDNLAGDDLVSLSTDFSIDKLSIIPWIADSPSTDYSELNLNLVYGFKLSDRLDLYAGYSYVYLRDSNTDYHDNEIGLELAYKVRKHLNLLTSIYYSFDASGSFMEVAVNYGIPLEENKIKFDLKGTLGANGGYVLDGHRGLNHFQIRLNMTYQPVYAVDLYAYAGYNFAINRDETRYNGDASLNDFLWGGIGFAYRF